MASTDCELLKRVVNRLPAECCSLQGRIDCLPSGRITRIALGNDAEYIGDNLASFIKIVSELQDLTALDIRNAAALRGPLPQDLGNLPFKKLKELANWGPNFQMLTFFGNVISNNFLSGEIPQEFITGNLDARLNCFPGLAEQKSKKECDPFIAPTDSTTTMSLTTTTSSITKSETTNPSSQPGLITIATSGPNDKEPKTIVIGNTSIINNFTNITIYPSDQVLKPAATDAPVSSTSNPSLTPVIISAVVVFAVAIIAISFVIVFSARARSRRRVEAKLERPPSFTDSLKEPEDVVVDVPPMIVADTTSVSRPVSYASEREVDAGISVAFTLGIPFEVGAELSPLREELDDDKEDEPKIVNGVQNREILGGGSKIPGRDRRSSI
ncbi:hypothetical protein HDU97_002875 [Phlyctochytrium planicorne]|nr:hypothetical protein HDU97_002875 [Phlyctochytrium planicorne]